MSERDLVYGKDLQEGQWYHSRFGYELYVEGGLVYKVRANGERLKVSPSAYSVFYKGRLKAARRKKEGKSKLGSL